MTSLFNHQGMDGTRRGFNPRMLTLARQARYFSQTDVASLVGVSQPLVARWEAFDNDAQPSSEQMDVLAAEWGFDPAIFYAIQQREMDGGSEYYHRARKGAKRSDVKAAHAWCAIMELQVDRMLELYDVSEDFIPDIDPDNHAGDIEKIAGLARLRMGIPEGPVENLVRLGESRGGLVMDRDFRIDGMDALCRWVPGLPKIFYVNGGAPTDRMRLSLAHELGHTVMHFQRDVEYSLAEEQAQRFAAAFLLPSSEVRRDFAGRLDLQRLMALKRKWRVSMQALAYRAHQIGCIDQTRFKSIFQQMSRKGWRKTEPVSIKPESPRGFNRMVSAHVEAGYSTQELARRLLLSNSEVGRLLTEVRSPDWETDGVRLRLVS